MNGGTLAVITGLLTLTGVVLGGLVRWVIRPLVRLFRKAESIADTWHGEPARDGLPARPGIVDRLIAIEAQIKVNGTGLPLGDATAELLKKADQLEAGRVANAMGIADLKDGQATAAEAAQQARDLAAEVHDELHDWIHEGQLREEAYLSVLREVHHIDIEPPPRRDPHTRTRADDERPEQDDTSGD